VVPSAHYDAIATTPTMTSSLRYFLSILQAMIFASIFFATLLICLMMIPCVPLSVSYLFFISLESDLSFVLSLRNCAGSMPHDGSPMMCAMSSMSIETSLSSHISLPCLTAINCLMQLLEYCPMLKCGSSNRPKIPVFANLASC
jgi:hypothetical protein